MTLLATTNISAQDAGLASGLFNTSQQIGGSVGLALLSTLSASAATAYALSHSHLPRLAAAAAAAAVHGYTTAFIWCS